MIYTPILFLICEITQKVPEVIYLRELDHISIPPPIQYIIQVNAVIVNGLQYTKPLVSDSQIMYSPLQSRPRCLTDLQTFSDVSLYGGLCCISLYLNEEFERLTDIQLWNRNQLITMLYQLRRIVVMKNRKWHDLWQVINAFFSALLLLNGFGFLLTQRIVRFLNKIKRKKLMCTTRVQQLYKEQRAK